MGRGALNTDRAKELAAHIKVLEQAYDYLPSEATSAELSRTWNALAREMERLLGRKFDTTSSFAYKGVDPARLAEANAR